MRRVDFFGRSQDFILGGEELFYEKIARFSLFFRRRRIINHSAPSGYLCKGDMNHFFNLFLDTHFSISTAIKTTDEAAPTPMNSGQVSDSVLNTGCNHGV